ncbi:cytochrome P450 [Saitoella complicata NRRL Y-17804]|uniref:Cytochrome P450 n=1 Tax=Saitoella complicata (strain BCRC 22490 / CBS 7301 / JCM 7358 / NBRC 10748 / NRRL Y-17804) TaxID=698492 RepID=A0A0E9NLC5_SAICN|nr:cytochrome P450 [Saitoella complicata NRRL Y-17804]ODQ51734.1 cytochrome P450 [Saitoella complicata NRRL Y-17804]GAO50649.1 hypothetical protein G7K_4772-t1 [Saitoella complicata NRRL Y-17804]
MSVLTSLIILLVTVGSSAYLLLRPRKRSGLPPGPPGHWLWANTFDLRGQDPWLKLESIAREYGPITHLRIGTRDYVWLNDGVAVKELLDKKSAIYSDRPHFPLAGVLARGSLRLLLMPYGDRWRTCRKLAHNQLTDVKATSYQSIQLLESAVLLRDFLSDPENFRQHLRRYTFSVIMQIVYGVRIEDWQHWALQESFAVNHDFIQLLVPGRWAVETYPFLSHLPTFLQPWREVGRKQHERERKLWLRLWEEQGLAEEAGIAPECFAKGLRQAMNVGNAKGVEEHVDDLQAAFLCGSMIGAGSDTTSMQLASIILAMLKYPECQKKAQQELDSVVGSGRLPIFDDAPNLPYVRALIRESQRWQPVTVAGLPHQNTKDDTYMGYRIPKGTIVTPNHWAIHMDPTRYPAPRTFNPDRFLGDTTTEAESAASANPSDRAHYGFGAGRRICVGIHVAQRSLFITVSRLLWAFEFREIEGKEVDETAYEQGANHGPKPFECDIRVREGRRGVIEKAVEGVVGASDSSAAGQ